MEKNKGNAKEIFKLLINKVEKEDLSKLAFEMTDGESHKLNKNKITVIVIDKFLEIAEENKNPLAKFGNEIRIYNGRFWEILDSNYLSSKLVEIALKMGVQILEAKHHKFQNELLFQLYARSYREFKEIDNSVLINVKNGTLEITRGQISLREFKLENGLIYQMNYDYNPKASNLIFQNNYLDKVLPKDLQLILAEAIANIFIKNDFIKLEKVPMLLGSGANGKSVVFEILNALLGEENISNYSLETLLDRNGYGRGMISGKLVNYASEISGKINANIFKQLASNEEIDARLPYGNPFIIKNYAKLMFNCNTLPETDESSNAFYRRLLIIPFDKTIPEKEQDKELSNKIIKNELSGVLNWVLEGLQRLIIQKNFSQSAAVDNALLTYKRSSDNVILFISENNYKRSVKSFQTIKFLYDDYKNFCIDWNYRPINKNKFISKIKSLNYDIKRMSSGIVAYMEVENKAEEKTENQTQLDFPGN